MKKTLIQNELECKKCGDIIYSEYRHDFKYCKCGSVAVDGGMDYIRRIGNVIDTVDRSMHMDEDALADCKEAIRWTEDTDRNELGTVLAVIRALRQHGLLDMSKFKYDSKKTVMVKEIEGKIKELEAENTQLQETVALYQRLHNKLMHENPEKNGRYFICGKMGEEDSLGLPDIIMVCPTYGLDGFQLYKKDGNYSAPGW